jgi:AcrR family transcriptional regulator
MSTQRSSKRRAAAARRSQAPKARQNTLSEADWVVAAEDLLAERNSGDVDIDSLCKRLGVTKGSFYWHFRGRSKLVSAILEDWRTRMTLDVNQRVLGIGGQVKDALRYLLGLIRKPRSSRNSAVEAKVRHWARTDSLARAAVLNVDQMRLAFFEELFRKGNFSERDARARAYLAYAVMMGDSILKDTIDAPRDFIDVFVASLMADHPPDRNSTSAKATPVRPADAAVD